VKVLFAPDWREGNAYQALLAQALANEGVEVVFSSGYKRGLPLKRGLTRSGADIVHCHWPEAYYPIRNDSLDWLRCRRFPFDLWLASQKIRFVTTAHNLLPHERPDSPAIRRNQAYAYGRSAVVFAHSEATVCQLKGQFGVDPKRIVIVPHGDLSQPLGEPVCTGEARARLGLGHEDICLMIGVVRPYKGIEGVIEYWKQHSPPCTLAIVGKPESPRYAGELTALTTGHPGIKLHLNWVSDEDFRFWLSVANCALFNYRQVLTSGAASIVRSWGIPLLIPYRLESVDLGEPSPLVIRFKDLEMDFSDSLRRALLTKSDWNSAQDWRERTAWSTVAKLSVAAYRRVLAGQ
jgi:glycosyltransferase involved in cell wall biosynthesis